MKMATSGQLAKIKKLFANTPSDQLQTLLGSGLLTDLRDGNTAQVNRDEFRSMLDLPAIMKVVGSLGFQLYAPRRNKQAVVSTSTLHGVRREKWPLWRTVTLGTHTSVNALRAALKAGGYSVSVWANDIFTNTTLASTETEVDLVLVSVVDLGFTGNTTTAKFFACAKKLGFALCPAEVGPALRLQYGDQPYGEYLWVGMEPISDSTGSRRVFGVYHDDGQWLRARLAYPAYVCDLSDQLVFARPRKPARQAGSTWALGPWH